MGRGGESSSIHPGGQYVTTARYDAFAGLRGRAVVSGAALLAIYSLIATISGIQIITAESLDGRTTDVVEVLIDQFLAIAPWIPATALVAIQTRRAFRKHDAVIAIGWLALVGLAIVGAINLMQAALLTILGSSQGVPWLEQYASGLAAAGHFGFLWYVLVTLIAYALAVREPRPSLGSAHEYANTVEVASGHSRLMLRPEEIEWIEARGDYVRVHARGDSYLKSERMKVLESVLDPLRFARVHRSAIVNLDRVREFHPIRRGDYQLVLESGMRVRLTRSRREAVLARLRATSR